MSSHSSAMQTEQEPMFANSQVLLNALPDGALLVDQAGVVQQANERAQRLLGLERNALIGRELAALLPDDAGNIATEQTRLIAFGEQTLQVAMRRLHVENDASGMIGTLVLLQDKTSAQNARHDHYEYVSRALHDVRVPLQAIGGAAEGLMRGWFGPLTDEQREFIGMIKDNAGRQGNLFSNLFDVYTLAEGHVALEAEPTQVEGLLHEVEHEFANRFAEKSIDVSLDVAPDLPIVAVDRRRLRQVLSGIFDNALKYTYANGTIHVRAFKRENGVQIEVEDTGVGIRELDQPNIFRPFFRGDSPLKEGRYGGLSLAIAKLLVELHGGEISFESVEGTGSTFRFTLPGAIE